jgi:hypothetical protein
VVVSGDVLVRIVKDLGIPRSSLGLAYDTDNGEPPASARAWIPPGTYRVRAAAGTGRWRPDRSRSRFAAFGELWTDSHDDVVSQFEAGQHACPLSQPAGEFDTRDTMARSVIPASVNANRYANANPLSHRPDRALGP